MITWKKQKAILLPSANGGQIGNNPNRLGENKLYYYNQGAVHCEAHHLHILSDDPIKIGDKIYECLDNGKPISIDTCTADHLTAIKVGIDTKCYKIIASTDKSLSLPGIPESFLKEFCERGGMEEVMVEYLRDGFKLKETDNGWVRNENDYKLFVKVSDCNEISIRPVKELWTRDDMENLIDFTRELAYVDGTKAQYKFSASDILDKWIEQNL